MRNTVSLLTRASNGAVVENASEAEHKINGAWSELNLKASTSNLYAEMFAGKCQWNIITVMQFHRKDHFEKNQIGMNFAILLHDNARLHVAKLIENTSYKGDLEDFQEVSPYPPYSFDIAPSDYHLKLANSCYKLKILKNGV
ncbi:hypothetical protein KIN20_018290 [Parelaphostrongylus tenuis]|uniref:Uncharacterized protein n=1 Tax=Parelaphostrongylus tenuis TaxID=148309 RepID=A0AAD5QS06_PARTN|nr:hypothetical protein KIN20_018290 [Parelaphostrongylus tenuis]